VIAALPLGCAASSHDQSRAFEPPEIMPAVVAQTMAPEPEWLAKHLAHIAARDESFKRMAAVAAGKWVINLEKTGTPEGAFVMGPTISLLLEPVFRQNPDPEVVPPTGVAMLYDGANKLTLYVYDMHEMPTVGTSFGPITIAFCAEAITPTGRLGGRSGSFAWYESFEGHEQLEISISDAEWPVGELGQRPAKSVWYLRGQP
jgi:hypothetical protein